MSEAKTPKDVLKIVKDHDVSFIQIWFTDVLGILKGFAITPSELEGALAEGMGFDGSSIEGFARIEESDMVAMPDPNTFEFLPWRPKERPVARMISYSLMAALMTEIPGMCSNVSWLKQPSRAILSIWVQNWNISTLKITKARRS